MIIRYYVVCVMIAMMIAMIVLMIMVEIKRDELRKQCIFVFSHATEVDTVKFDGILAHSLRESR